MGFAGYPTVRLMTLAETGTRGLLGSSPGDRDEATLARRLLRLLEPGMLVLLEIVLTGSLTINVTRFRLCHVSAAAGGQGSRHRCSSHREEKNVFRWHRGHEMATVASGTDITASVEHQAAGLANPSVAPPGPTCTSATTTFSPWKSSTRHTDPPGSDELPDLQPRAHRSSRLQKAGPPTDGSP